MELSASGKVDIQTPLSICAGLPEDGEKKIQQDNCLLISKTQFTVSCYLQLDNLCFSCKPLSLVFLHGATEKTSCFQGV